VSDEEEEPQGAQDEEEKEEMCDPTGREGKGRGEGGNTNFYLFGFLFKNIFLLWLH
jgi:hypothetical protein